MPAEHAHAPTLLYLHGTRWSLGNSLFRTSVPIPGTASIDHLGENMGAIENRNSTDVSFHFGASWRFGN